MATQTFVLVNGKGGISRVMGLSGVYVLKYWTEGANAI